MDSSSTPTITARGGQRLDQVSQAAYGTPHLAYWLAMANPEHALTWIFSNDAVLLAPTAPLSSTAGDDLPPWRR